MDVPQHFCVRWNSYKSNLQTAFPKLLTSEHFVDVTLACEKQFIKCHKIVLSACSVYFETLLVNNPCQHPIIFMKDVEFWEIKALVEFMYKGEVNVSQNQLDSLLKSAESLQIRGLSGTKQFVNFEQNNDCYTEGKGKRGNENEDEDDGGKKRKKKNEEEDKCVQITSIKGAEESSAAKSDSRKEEEEEEEEECSKVIKEEIVEDEYSYETGYVDTGEDEDGEAYGGDVFYLDNSNDPGPSGISDLRSLALNHVECVIDQDKLKTPSPTTTNAVKNLVKTQQRHQEHNYTNPAVADEPAAGKADGAGEASSSEGRDGQRIRIRAQAKADASQKQGVQPTSASPTEKPSEGRNKSIKKDVFNRIRRSEEELQKAAEMVRGGMTFQTASDTFNIPISTIRFYMARRGILPHRRRGRGSIGVRDDDLIHPPFEIIHYRLPDIDKPL